MVTFIKVCALKSRSHTCNAQTYILTYAYTYAYTQRKNSRNEYRNRSSPNKSRTFISFWVIAQRWYLYRHDQLDESANSLGILSKRTSEIKKIHVGHTFVFPDIPWECDMAGHKFMLWKEFQDTPHIVISNKTPKTEKISCYDNNSENCTHVGDQKSL